MKGVSGLLSLLVLVGCATAAGGSRNSLEPISQEEAVETGGSTVYDVVRVLRPGWLPRQPGSEIYVLLIDGSQGETPRFEMSLSARQEVGFLDPYAELVRERGWENVYQISWMDRTTATRYGSDTGAGRGRTRLLGAIVIRTIPLGDH